VCTACDASAYFLDAAGGVCKPRVPDGAQCAADSECASDRCAGGNCCNINEIKPGCVDCNFRGLCEGCAQGYTLCGHVQNNQGYGQCNVTIANPRDPVSFVCGVGQASPIQLERVFVESNGCPFWLRWRNRTHDL